MVLPLRESNAEHAGRRAGSNIIDKVVEVTEGVVRRILWIGLELGSGAIQTTDRRPKQRRRNRQREDKASGKGDGLRKSSRKRPKDESQPEQQTVMDR